MSKTRKTTMSVPEMRQLLGIGKTDSYWLVHKQCFETILVEGKMRVVIDSFEHWYANQIKYKKVDGTPPGEELRSNSYSPPEIAEMLGLCESVIYDIIKRYALMNRQRESGAFVLAVDLPSGINTDTGEAAEGSVRADLTVTFDSCKPLHTAPSSAPFCGEIVCADIGIRDEWHPAGLAQL